MLPENLNKNYIKQENIFKDYCYIVSKDKSSLILHFVIWFLKHIEAQ